MLQRTSDNNNIDHKFDENDVDSDGLVNKCRSDKANKLYNLSSATNDCDTDNAQQLSENISSDLINNGKTSNSDNSIAIKLEEVSRNRAIEQAHDVILKIFSDQCDIQTNSANAGDRFQLPKYDIAFQDMTSSTGTGTQMNTSTAATTTTKNSSNFHNNNNCSNNNNSNTKLDNILRRLTGK